MSIGTLAAHPLGEGSMRNLDLTLVITVGKLGKSVGQLAISRDNEMDESDTLP